jgi:16S rRNA (cytosine967-C5)-methyltransferase
LAKSVPGSGAAVRAEAARVILQVEKGRSLRDLLPQAQGLVEARDRGLLQELCYGTLRWYLRLQAVTQQLIERPLKQRDREIELLILVGLYQQLYMRLPQHAAVAATVEGARQLGRPWAVGLVNGVLRRFQREGEQLLTIVDREPTARFAHPEWLLEGIQQAWPQQWQSILEAANSRPPMILRVNLGRIGRQEYQKRLEAAMIAAQPLPDIPSALVLEQPVEVGALPGFSDGLVSVQDGGAQLAAGLLELQPGQCVLDVCSAPGGKSCHILELEPESRLTAVDVDLDRLALVKDNLQRLGLNAKVLLGDATDPNGEWAQAGSYDRILLDIPCSATGVIRRHPDIKLLRRPEDLERLVSIQRALLSTVWPLLKPGGILLYATCSLLPEENEQQVEWFLWQQKDARERPLEVEWGHRRTVGRQTLPGEATMDGFYYASVEKD